MLSRDQKPVKSTEIITPERLLNVYCLCKREYYSSQSIRLLFLFCLDSRLLQPFKRLSYFQIVLKHTLLWESRDTLENPKPVFP